MTYHRVLQAIFPITSCGLVVTKLSNLTFSHDNNSFLFTKQDVTLFQTETWRMWAVLLLRGEWRAFNFKIWESREDAPESISLLTTPGCVLQESQMWYIERKSCYFCVLHTNYCSTITSLDLSTSEKGILAFKDKDPTSVPIQHRFKCRNLSLAVEYQFHCLNICTHQNAESLSFSFPRAPAVQREFSLICHAN